MRTRSDRRLRWHRRLAAYGALVAATAACSGEFDVAILSPQCEASQASLDALDVAVAECQFLLAPDGVAAEIDEAYGNCLQKLRSAYEPIADASCPEASGSLERVASDVAAAANTASHDYADVSAWRRIAQPAEGSADAAQLIDPTDPRFADLQRRLGIVDAWLGFQLDLGLSIDELPSQLASIWRDAYAIPRVQPPQPQPTPDDVLRFLDVVDRFLMRDGLEDPHYRPLMRANIEAVALARISREIQARGELVHVLCTLGDCGVTVAVEEVAQAIVRLADDRVSPPTSTALGDRASAWVNALVAVYPHRARFRAALAILPNDAHVRLLNSWVGGLSHMLQRLQTEPSERRPLASRLHDENRQDILRLFLQDKNELTGALQAYQQAKVQYANDQIAALGQQASELGLGNELLRNLEVLDDAATRMTALRQLYDAAQQRWAALGDFTTRVDRLGLRGEVVLTRAATPISVPLPAAARFTAADGGATTVNLPSRSLHAWTVAQGDTLRVTVNNRWSPTCSLQLAGLGDNPLFEGVDTTYAETGPEGYYLSYSQSTFSTASSYYSNADLTPAGVCRATQAIASSILASMGGAGLAPTEGASAARLTTPRLSSLWGSVTDFISDVAGMTPDCVEGLLGGGSSSGSQSSDGSESRWNAAFSGGIRLANTPFPTLPTGSLVVALVSGNSLVDAYVVQASAAIQMPVGGVAYLVVNDIRDSQCTNQTGTLLVDWVHGKSIGPLAKQLAESMGQIATEQRVLIDQIASTRQFSPADGDAFRVSARQRLHERCGDCDIDATFPPAVMGMFNEWIAHEVAQLQRSVDLARLAFDVRQQQNVIDSLSGQFAIQQARGVWAEHLKQLAFTEMAHQTLGRLEDEIEDIARFVDRRVLPVLEVRYPNALTDVHAVSITSVADLDLSIEELATDLVTLVNELAEAIDHASTDGRGESTISVLLWIPKPGVPRTFNGGQTRVLVADDDDIANVWTRDANGVVRLDDNARVRLSTSELYSPDSGISDRLGCGRTAPIIRSLFLYGVQENHPFPFDPLSDPININRNFVSAKLSNPTFVTDNGPKIYDLVSVNSAEVRFARGRFDDRQIVADAFHPVETTMVGVSPVVDIQLADAAGMNGLLAASSGLALMMRVSAYLADSGISHCD